jgi:hypothetical protein
VAECVQSVPFPGVESGFRRKEGVSAVKLHQQ